MDLNLVQRVSNRTAIITSTFVLLASLYLLGLNNGCSKPKRGSENKNVVKEMEFDLDKDKTTDMILGYDSTGHRIEDIYYSEETDQYEVPDFSHEYDTNGNLIKRTNYSIINDTLSTNIEKFEYDANGKKIKEYLDLDGDGVDELIREFGSDGEMTESVYKKGKLRSVFKWKNQELIEILIPDSSGELRSMPRSN